jgi:NADH-quinone oxidoreductase subunit J
MIDAIRLVLVSLVVVLGAAGTYLMLPHRHGTARPRREYGAGCVSASLALLLFLGFWSPPGPFLATVFFYVFSLAAIAGAFLTVTSRNPVYTALWFASVVLSTAGLFLLGGAPFLAAGTVIVYAGAIIVTFLFVIMLAQMEGKALYDRSARSPGAATLSCFLLLWSLIYSLSAIKTRPEDTVPDQRAGLSAQTTLLRAREIDRAVDPAQVKAENAVVDRARPPTNLTIDSKGAEKPNVAGLGESLYTDHLITAGLAGVLLFVALVGAVAITNPRKAAIDHRSH